MGRTNDNARTAADHHEVPTPRISASGRTVDGVSSLPEHLRPAVAAEIDRLVRGEHPELLLWVHRYGAHGATLVPQPADIFDHRLADAVEAVQGGWALDLPLWTTEESPSDLTVSLTVTAAGMVTIDDLRML